MFPQGLLEIMCAASEYDTLPQRPGDEEAVRRLLMHAQLAVESAKWGDPHTKANALLQAHFSRTHLGPDLQSDQRQVVGEATRLLQVGARGALAGVFVVVLQFDEGVLCCLVDLLDL
jgi:pre-mRNA-splicing helicase BRR2